MKTTTKLISAVAVAGLAFASSSALTGTGLSTTAGATQFIGGTVSQTVTGATLSDLTYGFANESKTIVNAVTLTFGSSLPTGPTVVVTSNENNAFTCTKDALNELVYECAFVANGTETGVTGVSGVAVTVVGDEA